MRLMMAALLFISGITAQTVLTTSQPEGEYPQFFPDPFRDPWQKPDQVIAALNFATTETVAVIENGLPYFAPRIAPHVKRTYAVNSDARVFQGITAPPPTVLPILATPTNPNVSAITADTIMMVDMLRFLPQRAQYYPALALGLKPGGRLIIIDRKLPSVFPAAVNITSTVLLAELPLSGFKLLQQFTFLNYQYFVVFQR